MTWVYLDDRFPDHPKVEAAGGDAAWLFIAGLCFANHQLTGGRILKRKVPGLTDRKQSGRLAARLVEVGLWEDDGDAYLIHDYDTWNRGAAERSKKAKNAARTRWGNTPPIHPIEQSNGQCSEHAPSTRGVLETCEAGKKQPDAALKLVEPDIFDEFWDAYPRKVGKPAARKAWSRVAAEHPAVMAGVAAWSAAWARDGTADRFVPHPSTWLTDRRWENAPPAPTRRPPPPAAAEDGVAEYLRRRGVTA